MNIDDLQARWQDHDRKLDAALRLNTRVLRELTLGKASAALGTLSRRVALGLALDLATLALLVGYLAGRVDQLRFVAPAAVLALFTLAMVVSSVVQLVRIKPIEYGVPVVTIQRQLEAIGILRITTTRWIFVLALLLWTPLLIVVMDGVLGLDAYALLDRTWLLSNALLGVVAIPVSLWLSRRYADRMAGSPRLQRFMKDLAGQNLAAAHGFLDTLAAFERDPA